MKELFTAPEMEVLHFEAVDIITTSTQMDDDELPPLVVG